LEPRQPIHPRWIVEEGKPPRPLIDDDMIERGAEAIYEMTRGAELPGVLNGVRVSHVGGRQLAEAVLRASLGED
jgi:hypothetical protein